MDPISQGSIGASLAQSQSKQATVKSATLMGCFGGLAPDLDILIFSPSDPLLFLEFHRQFTHALIFIPVGALLVTLVMHRFIAKDLPFKMAYLFAMLGYATHAVLDACTTYGTQLLWPFTSERFAWNTISIIDPLFTFPILGLVIAGAMRKQPWFARAAVAWALVYMSIGLLQRERAEAAGYELAASRGHEPVRLEAKPGFAQLLVWKVVYEADERFFVDAVRVGVDAKTYAGASTEKLDVTRHFPWLIADSQQAVDIERFRWFSNDYLALDPLTPNRVIDVRYSTVPNEINALWAIDLVPDKAPDEHIIWQSLRQTDSKQTQSLWRMIQGEDL